MVMQKFTFDGPNKLFVEKAEIINASGESAIDIQVDLYSDWKEHIVDATGDDLKFLQALRTVGGDPLTAGRDLGDTYFLTNGWRIRPAETGHRMVLTGNIFTEEGDSAIVATTGAHNVLAEMFVSNLVDASATVADFDVEKMQHLIESQRPTHAAFGNVFYWDSVQGQDTNNGLTPDLARKTFASIHDNLVVDGNHDAVFMISTEPTGTVDVDEQVKITKRAVYLRGNGFHTRINPTSLPSGEAAVEIQADLCEVDSFRVFCTGIGVPAVQCRASDFKCSVIFVERCGGDAISVSGARHVNIDGCTLHDCTDNGINMVDCGYSKVQRNTVHDVGGWGLEMTTTSENAETRSNVIGDDNIIHSNGSGIHIGTGVVEAVIRKDNYFDFPASGQILDEGTNTKNEIVDFSSDSSQAFLDATTSEGVTFDTVLTALNAMARGRIVESSSNVFDFYDNAGTGILFTLTKTATERQYSGVSI